MKSPFPRRLSLPLLAFSLLAGVAGCGGSAATSTGARQAKSESDFGFRLRYALAPASGIEGDAALAALDQSLPVLRKRAAELKLPHATISRVGSEIVVELAGENELSVVDLREVLRPAGVFELRLVQSEGDFMQRVCASLATDSKAGVMRIETGLDIWQDGSGATVKQCYLAAADRVAMLNSEEAAAENCRSRGDAERTRCVVSGQTLLRRYLSGRTDIEAEPGFELAFESSESSGIDGEIGERYWRSYYLRVESLLDDRSIVSARVESVPDLAEEELVITLDNPAKATLAQLSKENVGHKLALLVDGRVEHAFVIREAMENGILRAQLGPTSTAVSLLAPALHNGRLPALLVEVSAEAY